MRTSKVCSKCKVEKPASAFSPRRDRPGGLYSCCKQCKAAFRSQRYRERREEDPQGLWIVNARSWAKDRARKKNVPFTLTKKELEAALEAARGQCAYCDIVMNFQRNLSTRTDSPTIDRIVGDLGYTAKNVVVCCFRCNQHKNDAAPDELMRLATRVACLVRERDLGDEHDGIDRDSSC